MAKILAIVVTFNAMAWLDKCFGSLEKSSVKVDAFVVDNGSLDGTNEYIRENWPGAVLVENEENLGFGAANNLGFKYAIEHGYDYVYLLNQDAWVEHDTIEKLVAEWKPSYGILSPVQMNGKGRKMDKNFARKCKKYLNREFPDPNVATVPFVMAAHWLISRKALETVGGFSPAFKQYGEDDNWIDRLHWFGYKVGVVRNAKAVHDRADRKATKEQRMKLKCVAAVVKLSNPSNDYFARHLVEPLELVGMTVKNLSMIPLRYIPEFLGRYGELKKLRAESRQQGAFLK